MCSFGPKPRDIPSKGVQQLQYDQTSRQLTRAHPKSEHFPRAAAPKVGKNGHPNLQG